MRRRLAEGAELATPVAALLRVWCGDALHAGALPHMIARTQLGACYPACISSVSNAAATVRACCASARDKSAEGNPDIKPAKTPGLPAAPGQRVCGLRNGRSRAHCVRHHAPRRPLSPRPGGGAAAGHICAGGAATFCHGGRAQRVEWGAQHLLSDARSRARPALRARTHLLPGTALALGPPCASLHVPPIAQPAHTLLGPVPCRRGAPQ